MKQFTIPCFAAEDARFIRGTRIVNNIGVSPNLSDDGQVVTVLFDDLVVGTHAALRMPLIVTRTATVIVPILGNDKPVTIRYDIRGFVQTDELSRAVLVVQACGKTIVIDLKKAIDDVADAPTRTWKKERAKPDALRSADDFYATFTGTLPAKAVHACTFFLLVEKDRDDVDAGAVLHIDSVDISLNSEEKEQRP